MMGSRARQIKSPEDVLHQQCLLKRDKQMIINALLNGVKANSKLTYK